MKRINRLLENMEQNYGVYIGTKSLPRLATFISGYECAIFDLTGERIGFNAEFQHFVEQKEHWQGPGKHWAAILEEGRTPEQAFDLFFDYMKDLVQAKV